METTQYLSWKYSGILILAGGIIFWIGAFYPPYKQWMTSDIKEYLTIINSNKTGWYVIHSCFILGIIVSIFGWELLSESLISSGTGNILPKIAYTSLFAGSIFWLINIAFRLTVTLWAAENFSSTGVIYESFKTWMDWSNLLFVIYMVLAYFATGCFGIAMREISWIPAWVSWFYIIFGFAGVIGYLVRIPVWVPPLMVHLPYIISGIVILLKLPKE